MARSIIWGVAVSAFLLAGSVMADDAAKENAAVLAAQHWLAMVDGGQYAHSWDEAAEYFKGAVTREQ